MQVRNGTTPHLFEVESRLIPEMVPGVCQWDGDQVHLQGVSESPHV